MSKLLKGKRVFIDTQVFRKARFGVASPAFKKLAAISKDRGVILITTSITKREIEAQIDEIAPEIKTAFGRAASLLLGFGLPELIIRGSTASTFSETQVATLLKEFMADFFRDCSVEEIALPKDALSNTLDLYFQKRPPFGNAKKKSEFPDAFVLEALKSKAGVNGESVYVISEDPDLEAACKESPYLEHLPSVAHFLDLWNLHSNTIKQVRATLRDNSSRIHNELDRIVESISGEMDTPGVVEMSHRKIADILDELVISCDASKASVEFVCFVEFEGYLEIHPANNAPVEHRLAESGQQVTITLEFRFSPDDPKIFEVETYWAPQSITFSAHSAR
jgi:hypothetical protein